MIVEDIQKERNNEIKLKALCESQGIKFKDNPDDRFDIRNIAKQRQQQRLNRSKK